MEISVAGAGAGKTTTMADKVVTAYDALASYQNLYYLAFTNNAVSRIQEKLSEHYDEIPKNIIVCTIHSFLYQELIKPYYFLLYGRQYERVSSIDLPQDAPLRNKKISELGSKGIIHVSVIPQRAKWVVVKKSSDKKREKKVREKILKNFIQYCGKIFIDEAQDIDNNVLEIIRAFDATGVAIELVGDPKQDLHGLGSFRRLITEHIADTTFLSKCYRCPQQHLKISNSLVIDEEKQESDKTEGTIQVEFESKIRTLQFLKEKDFDLSYISERNRRFETRSNEAAPKRFETLNHEIEDLLMNKSPKSSKTTLASRAYYITYKMLKDKKSGLELRDIIQKYLGRLSDRVQYAKVITALQRSDERATDIPIVDTIEGIKGQEGNNCLFILTTDLAPYLFGDKTIENKTKNKLYVALTRSLNSLTILILQEVENKYGEEYICNFFRRFYQNNIVYNVRSD